MEQVVVLPGAPAAPALERRARAAGFGPLVSGTVTPHLRSTWLQSHQFGWGAVLVQSRNSWKRRIPRWAHGTSDGSEGRDKTLVWSVLFLQGWMCEMWCFGNVLPEFPPGSQKCKGSAAEGRWILHLSPGVSWASLRYVKAVSTLTLWNKVTSYTHLWVF